MTPKQTLIAARALIEKPEHWTQQTAAKSMDMRICNPRDEQAYCFCSMGAIDKASNTNKMYMQAQKALKNCTGCEVAQFNDTHTHAEVLAMFDKAIESCGEQS